MNSYAQALLQSRENCAHSPVSIATDFSASVNEVVATTNKLTEWRTSADADELAASVMGMGMPPIYEQRPAEMAANHFLPELPPPLAGFSPSSTTPSPLLHLGLPPSTRPIFGLNLLIGPLPIQSAVLVLAPAPAPTTPAPTTPAPASVHAVEVLQSAAPVVYSVVQQVLSQEVSRPAVETSATTAPPTIVSDVVDVNVDQRWRSLFSSRVRNLTSRPICKRASAKAKPGKLMTSMCTNGRLRCIYGDRCNFAHFKDELVLFTKKELMEKKPNSVGYLSHVCWHHVVNGQW